MTSRQRKRIQRAVELRGFHVKELDWEPLAGDVGDMGNPGGWALVVDRPYVERTWPGDDLYGLSVEELLADIDWSLRPPEPCACQPWPSPAWMPLHHLKGDPQRPLHEPGCRWFVDYRLRWWPAPGAPAEAASE